MKNICVPIDFSETSRLAINYGCHLANKAGGPLQILHVWPEEEKHASKANETKLREFAAIDERCQVPFEFLVEYGNFAEIAPKILQENHSDLVVIGTHGVKGIFQTMQGADVLKLIQHLGIPSLILQNQTSEKFNQFQRILFPIASHSNFEIKARQTAKLARLFNSQIWLYLLTRENGEVNEVLRKNLDLTQKVLREEKIEFRLVEEISKVYGVGYAQQALRYGEKNDIELYSIMAHSSDELSYFGNFERSEFILNKPGVPVLCCS